MTASKPKILVIGPTPPPHHGVAVMTHNLLRWGEGGPFQLLHLDLADRRGIQHVDRPDLHDVFLFLRQWTTFFRLLLRERPPLLYLSLSQSTIGFLRDSLFLWPALLLGCRTVVHLHGSHLRQWVETLSPPGKAFVRRTLKRTSRFIILGESLRPLFEGLVPAERIAVVPNGVAWGPAPAREPGDPPGGRRYRILHLGTLCREKGALVVLEAVSLVLRRRRDAEFVLAGPWLREEDRKAAQVLIDREGVKDHVVFAGPVAGEEKKGLFESSDLFVFPGIQPEGQPLVLIEAMAAGLPVLFTDRGCAGETVIDGENGLKVEIGDPRDLSRKILDLLDSPERMRAMSRQSRLRYEFHYTDAHFTKKMMEVMIQAWEEKRG